MKALAILVIGAIFGIAFAFATRGGPYSFVDWISFRYEDAVIWAVAGAIVSGSAAWLTRR